MITPAFELSQDADFLTMVVRVPYTRTSEFDIYIQGDDLKFYAKPYFLRLTLPGRIVEDGRERASFDVDKGLFTLRVPKEIAGQNFEGLEMLTSLLAPKGSRSAKPLVEEAETSEEGSAEACEEDEEDEEFDWQIEQEVYTETPEETLKKYHKYGFANLRTGVFSRLQDELNEVIDLKDPDHTAPELRRSLRLDAETAMFCPDHYLGNLYEDEEEIKTLLKFKPWWTELSSPAHSNDSMTFTDEEKEQMRKFTNRSYPLDKKARFRVWLGLVDILLAYVYDVRTTEGEHNVESAWTIRKLSGTLIWLETYHSVQDVLVAFGRRTLCYPLFRHFSLVTKAVKDVAGIFQSGKACVLRCLLAIHKIFRENDPAYILNDLFITDYCIWIQKVKSKHVMALAEPLHKAKLQKCDLDLELEILEQAAELVVMEEEEEEEEEEEDSSSEESEEADSTSLDLQKHGETPAAEAMMEELRGRLEAGLKIQEDAPRERQPVRGERERESERSADADDSQHSAAKPASSAELLHPPLRKNPLLVVAAGDLDSDDEEEDDDDDDDDDGDAVLMAARP